MEHPHSEPLRVLHDFGLVGFMLSIGLLVSFLKTVRTQVAGTMPTLLRWRLAAASSILTFLLLGLFENFLVFPWIMLPLAVIIGLGVGAASAQDKISERTWN